MTVAQAGLVQLSPTVNLHDVLHIPSFRSNLLFVSKLLHDLYLQVNFSLFGCLIQDLMTREVIAVGKLKGDCIRLTSQVSLQPPLLPFLLNTTCSGFLVYLLCFLFTHKQIKKLVLFLLLLCLLLYNILMWCLLVFPIVSCGITG